MSISVSYRESDGFTTPTPGSPAPAANCVLEYLDEGGANVVFRILPRSPDHALPMHLRGKLLRLRKDLPHVQSAREQATSFGEHFMPLFPAQSLLQPELVALGEGLPSLVNAKLAMLDRPARRGKNILPCHETHGLLIADMTARAEMGELLLQVKPKWLAQSPNAPPGARRCRTCALRARRASQQMGTGTDAQPICPLALVSPLAEVREWAASAVTRDEQTQRYLAHEALPLLLTLKTAQTCLDPYGVLHTQSHTSVFGICKAMTVRDCTLFLKRSGSRVEARLADLDLKHADKLAAWKETEQSLISEGWYTNTEESALRANELVCVLSSPPQGSREVSPLHQRNDLSRQM